MSNYLLIPGDTTNTVYNQLPLVTRSSTAGQRKFAFLWCGVLPDLSAGVQRIMTAGTVGSSNARVEMNNAGEILLRLRTATTNPHTIQLDAAYVGGTKIWLYCEVDFDAAVFRGVYNGTLINTVDLTGEDPQAGPYDYGIALNGFPTDGDDQKVYAAAGWYNRLPVFSEILDYEPGDDLSLLSEAPDAVIDLVGTVDTYADELGAEIGSFVWDHVAGPTTGGNEPVYGEDASTAPVMPADTAFDFNEGETVLGTYAASSGSEPKTYTLTGADAALFSIDAGTAEITWDVAPVYATPTDANADGVYVITVVATNSAGSDSQTLTITVLEVVVPEPGELNYLNLPGTTPTSHVYTPAPLVTKSTTAGQRKVALLLVAKLPIIPSGVKRVASSSPISTRDMRVEVNSAGDLYVRMRTSTTNSHLLTLGPFTEGQLVYLYAEADYDAAVDGGTEQFTAAFNGVETTPISLAGQTWDHTPTEHGMTLSGIDVDSEDIQWFAAAAWYNKKPIKSEALAYALGDNLASMTVPPDAQINMVGTDGAYAASLSSLIGSFTWAHNSSEGAPDAGADAPTFENEGVATATAPVMPADAAINVDEGTTALSTSNAVSGTAPITYSLTGADASLFSINASTGVVVWDVAPVFDTEVSGNNIYVINKVATNSEGSDSQQITITVLQVVDGGSMNRLNLPGVTPSSNPTVAAHIYAPAPLVAKSTTAGQRKVALLFVAKLPVIPAGVKRILSSSPVSNRDMRLEINNSGGLRARLRTNTNTGGHDIEIGTYEAGDLVTVYMEADYDDATFTAAVGGVEATPISLAGQTWDDTVNTQHGVSLLGLDVADSDIEWYSVAAWYNKKPVKVEALAYALGDDLSEMTVPPDAQISFIGADGSYPAILSSIIGSFSWYHNSSSGAPTIGADAPEIVSEEEGTAPVISSVTGRRLGSLWQINYTNLDGTPTSITVNGVESTALNKLSSSTSECLPSKDLGAAINSVVNVVVTDQFGASSPFAVTLLPPEGFASVVMTTINAGSQTHAAYVQGAISNAVVAGDVGYYKTTAVNTETENTYPFTLTSDGFFEVGGGAPAGTYAIQLGWQDASSNYAYGEVITQFIQIGELNNAPTLTTALGSQTVVAGTAWSIDVSGNFSDPDDDTLTFSKVSGHEGIEVSSVGLVTPVATGASGVYSATELPIVVGVSDGEGGTAQGTLLVNFGLAAISAFSFAPELDATPGQSYQAVVTKSGLTVGSRVVFSNCEVSVDDGGSYTSASPAYIGAPGTLRIRPTVVASSNYNTPASTTAVVNGTSAVFTVTTGASPYLLTTQVYGGTTLAPVLYTGEVDYWVFNSDLTAKLSEGSQAITDGALSLSAPGAGNYWLLLAGVEEGRSSGILLVAESV